MAKATILLVQNAQIQGNGTRRILESTGYDVVWAGSGMSALATVKQQAIDLILLDAALPDMEGSDLCRRFRLRDDTGAVPIILLTGHGFSPGPFTGLTEGPDDYLAKPYTESELDARISAALKTRTLRNELEQKNRQLAETLSQFETMAVVDPATGLFNRRQFEAMFSKEFKRAVRFKQQMSCMLIDLDGRKMGRKADEALVKAIIRLVQSTIREVDTAAWWTGEAFIVLLPNTIRNDAVQAAARILEAVANHPFTWPDSTKVTMSIGVAGLPDRNINTEQKLIEAADAACRRARELMLPLLHHVPARR
jgi:diguanylate cyclase (GGDEF)-like protein